MKRNEVLTEVKALMGLLSNSLNLWFTTNEEITTSAAKVAACREKGTSEARAISELDATCDYYRDTLEKMITESIAGYLPDYSEILQNNAIVGIFSNAVDLTMKYYKEIAITGSAIAINTVLHPKKVKALKDALSDLSTNAQIATYDYIKKILDTLAELFGDEFDEESVAVFGIINEWCAEQIESLRDSLNNAKKVNPFIIDLDTDELIASIQEMTEEIKEAESVVEEEEVVPQQGYGYGYSRKESPWFNA